MSVHRRHNLRLTRPGLGRSSTSATLTESQAKRPAAVRCPESPEFVEATRRRQRFAVRPLRQNSSSREEVVVSRRSIKVILGVCLVGLGLGRRGTRDSQARKGPTSGGVVQACYDVSSGALRLVGSPTECTGRENSISWNQTGAVGPVGPMGEPGPAGPAGPAGRRGPAGTIAVRVQGNGPIDLSGLLTLEQKLLIKTLTRLKKIEQKLDAVGGKLAGLDEALQRVSGIRQTAPVRELHRDRDWDQQSVGGNVPAASSASSSRCRATTLTQRPRVREPRDGSQPPTSATSRASRSGRAAN